MEIMFAILSTLQVCTWFLISFFMRPIKRCLLWKKGSKVMKVLWDNVISSKNTYLLSYIYELVILTQSKINPSMFVTEGARICHVAIVKIIL